MHIEHRERHERLEPGLVLEEDAPEVDPERPARVGEQGHRERQAHDRAQVPEEHAPARHQVGNGV